MRLALNIFDSTRALKTNGPNRPGLLTVAAAEGLGILHPDEDSIKMV